MSRNSQEERGRTRPAAQPAAVSGPCIVRILDGDGAGRAIQLTGTPRVIGSDSGCDLVVADPTVSSRHASLALEEGQIRLCDLGSTNGTWYLETRVTEAAIPLGAVIRIGETRLAVLPEKGDAPEPGPQREQYGSIRGASAAMQKLYALLERLEQTEFTVLIGGETGTGKELVAREIHQHSGRREGPYEVFDCGAVSPRLIESELFGHVRGAFTGADRDHTGVFERARGGTVFLDEVGELSLELQPKLLRALENREVHPVGAQRSRPIDVRLVAATNRDLEAAVKEGTFRRDLFFRLAVLQVQIPPLRDRLDDIPMLVAAVLEDLGGGDVELSPETIELMRSGYRWPGNVRELRNAVSRLMTLGELPFDVGEASATDPDLKVDTSEPFLELKKRIVDAFERDYLATQMRQCEDNISEAARASGMDRAYFRRLLVKHGLV